MQSQSLKAYSIEELKTALDRFRKNGFVANLAIVFAHVDFDLQMVGEAFLSEGIDCIAASSAGEFIDGSFEQPGIAVLLLQMDPSFYKLVLAPVRESLVDAVTLVAKAGIDAFIHPAYMVLVSGLTNDGEVIVSQIQKTAGETTPIFGGFASEPMKLTTTFIAVNGQIEPNGVAALVLDTEKLSVKGLAAGGWKPIGIVRTITKSEGNKVLMIDDEPALDLIMRYLRMSDEDFNKGQEVIAGLSKKFQLQLQRTDSYAVMRAPIAVDTKERSVSYTGGMPQGTRVQFTLLPSFEVIENVISEFARIRQQEERPDAVLLFSCKARQMIFGPMIAEEVERIGELWDVPMAGFLSYGEMGKVKTRSEYHGMVCSLVLLKEKEN